MSDKSLLIQVADNCPVDKGTPPAVKRKENTIHILRYEVLSEHPYEYDYEAFMHEVHVVRRGKDAGSLKLNRYNMRRSLLSKKHGWGIHFDENGKVALVGCETRRYRLLSESLETEKAYRAART